MTFEEYVIRNYPAIAEEYIAYVGRNILPEIGDLVITLRAGFGGSAGLIRKVVSVDDKYITLSGDGCQFLSHIETWYKDI